MDNLKTQWARHAPTKRRLIQLYTALLYNAHAKGFLNGEIYVGAGKSICVPGLNCYSCPGAVGACPLGALQNAMAATPHRAPYYVLGILLLFALTLGRTICGFLCPFGLIQELLHKIPTPKLRKSRITRALTNVKYVLLAVLVVLVPLWYGFRDVPLPAFCKTICPAGTLEGAISLLLHPTNRSLHGLLGAVFSLKMAMLIGIVALCVFAYRGFCRFICPLGALYGLFNRFSLIGVRLEPTRCIDCGRCVRQCEMDVRHVGDRECIQCGACIRQCPTDAIEWRCGSRNIGRLTPAVKKGLAAVAVAALVAVIVAVNLPTKEVVIPVGIEVGDRCPDFTVSLLDEQNAAYTLSEHNGRIRVLNFWATWCTPCVKELPEFEAFVRENSDRVDVLAVHTSMITDDVAKWVQDSGLKLDFALDKEGTAFSSLGGTTMLPMTVIVDQKGVILYNAVGSMTKQRLEEILADV